MKNKSKIRITFAGSFSKDNKNIEIIKRNISDLACHILERGDTLLIRDTPDETQERYIIDKIVYDAYKKYCDKGKQKDPDKLIVYQESNTSLREYTTPITTHIAETESRKDFYKELIKLVDLVIGVGGEFGLLRLSISCEWNKTPLIILPGAGETSELIWKDYITKSFYINQFNEKEKTSLKRIIPINQPNENYAEAVYLIILTLYKKLKQSNLKKKNNEVISLNKITPKDCYDSIKRFSISTWLTLISTIIVLISISYTLGQYDLFQNIVKYISSKDSN